MFDSSSSFPLKRDINHTILLLPNSKPINLRPYRCSHYQKCELEKIIDELLSTKVIRHSNIPFASPALLVKKKDGNWRFCVD
jgi:hypothetical protein